MEQWIYQEFWLWFFLEKPLEEAAALDLVSSVAYQVWPQWMPRILGLLSLRGSEELENSSPSSRTSLTNCYDRVSTRDWSWLALQVTHSLPDMEVLRAVLSDGYVCVTLDEYYFLLDSNFKGAGSYSHNGV